MDIQELVLATTPYKAHLALMIIKTFCRQAEVDGMGEKHLGSVVLRVQGPLTLVVRNLGVTS